MNKILLFGAGKIGRSFIGQLFSNSGYEVIFVDIDQKIIELLNKRNSYPVIIKSEKGDKRTMIENVRGLHLSETGKITMELLDTPLIATAVGPENLGGVLEIIAKGLKMRYQSQNAKAVDIIIAENLRNASDFFMQELRKYLNVSLIRSYVGLIETSIGKMVPIMTTDDMEKDPLMVYAEPYNTLILDRKGFRNPVPQVEGLAPKKDMKAWVDRKSFIHNLGHAAAAYYGYLRHPEQKYLYDVLADEEILNFTRSAMQESAEALRARYPDSFTWDDLIDHIEDLLKRFQNKALGDTVYRVGRDLYRKLGPEDRLCGAIRMAIAQKKPYRQMLSALVAGFYFRAGDERGSLYPRDQEFALNFKKTGFLDSFRNVCKFKGEEYSALEQEALEINKKISNTFNTGSNQQ